MMSPEAVPDVVLARVSLPEVLPPLPRLDRPPKSLVTALLATSAVPNALPLHQLQAVLDVPWILSRLPLLLEVPLVEVVVLLEKPDLPQMLISLLLLLLNLPLYAQATAKPPVLHAEEPLLPVAPDVLSANSHLLMMLL